MKPGSDLTVTYLLSSGNEEFYDSVGIIIYFLKFVSNESNQWSIFYFVWPLEVSNLSILVKYYLILIILEIQHQYFHGCLSSSKSLEVTPCTYEFFCSQFCKMTINYLQMALQCLVPDHIHDDVIQHQTTWYDTSMIIVTYILLFQRIKNWMTFQYNIFDGGKNSFPNGGNIILWFLIYPCIHQWTFI